MSSKDFKAINNFEEYINYVKSHRLRYNPVYFYLSDPKIEKDSERYHPIAYRVIDIEITPQTINDIADIYGIDADKITSDHLLLLGNETEYSFLPFHPNLKVRLVTLDYKGKRIKTPMWLSIDSKKNDIDYIFMDKANADALIEGDILFGNETMEYGLETYKNRGFGFVTWNPDMYMYNGYVDASLGGTRYIAFAKMETRTTISSVLYIAIQNEETGEEKVFSKEYDTRKNEPALEELLNLVIGTWE